MTSVEHYTRNSKSGQMAIMLLHIILTACPVLLTAQEKRDYVWQLGLETLGDTVPYSLEFDFNEGQLSYNRIFRDWSLYLTNASICDKDGSLILSTNGCSVFGGDHSILANGDGLNPGIAYETQCENGFGYAVTDGAQFVHFGDSIYILLHLADQYLFNPTRVFVNRVLVTTMHKGLSEPLVLTKNQLVLADTLARGVECVRHSGGWWCIVQGEYDPDYYILDITKGGVTLKKQQIGVATSGLGGGQTAFSPDGTHYARYTFADQLFLFDFDRINGELNNFRQIHVSDSGSIGGVAFSPSSQYLYISTQFDLYQIDTWAENIQSSITHIAHYDGFFSPFPTTFFLMQLGPDCRIYMIPPFGVDVMHVIHEPDLPGIDCNFEQHGIQLPTYNSITLPNFPNYRLDIGPPCDPSITGLADVLPKPELVRIGPNPAADHLNIWMDIGTADLLFFNAKGQLVFSTQLTDNTIQHRIDLDLPNGLYFYRIQSATLQHFTGKLLIQRAHCK